MDFAPGQAATFPLSNHAGQGRFPRLALLERGKDRCKGMCEGTMGPLDLDELMGLTLRQFVNEGVVMGDSKAILD